MIETEIFPAPILSIPNVRISKFERERDAFHRLVPTLLKDYCNHYVAIHEEQVVGSGDNLLDVADAAYAKFGYQPIYVDLVTDQPPLLVAHTIAARLFKRVSDMIRYKYVADKSPPAPFVHVVLRNPMGDLAVNDIPALLDQARIERLFRRAWRKSFG